MDLFPDFSHGCIRIRLCRMQIGGLLRAEVAVREIVVYFQAGPGVDRGIGLLSGREFGGLPVAQALVLGDAAVEEDAVDLLKTGIGDAECLDEVLQIDEVLRIESGDAVQHMEVVAQR